MSTMKLFGVGTQQHGLLKVFPTRSEATQFADAMGQVSGVDLGVKPLEFDPVQVCTAMNASLEIQRQLQTGAPPTQQ